MTRNDVPHNAHFTLMCALVDECDANVREQGDGPLSVDTSCAFRNVMKATCDATPLE
jgi:hypothetical protein